MNNRNSTAALARDYANDHGPAFPVNVGRLIGAVDLIGAEQTYAANGITEYDGSTVSIAADMTPALSAGAIVPAVLRTPFGVAVAAVAAVVGEHGIDLAVGPLPESMIREGSALVRKLIGNALDAATMDGIPVYGEIGGVCAVTDAATFAQASGAWDEPEAKRDRDLEKAIAEVMDGLRDGTIRAYGDA